MDNVINYAELVKDGGLLEIAEPYIDVVEDFSKSELINLEHDTYGFYLMMHPTLIYKNSYDVDLINVSKYFDKRVSCVIVVDRLKEVVTKNNDIMLFINGSDNTDTISVTLFPRVYELNKNINRNDIIRVSGIVEKRFDKYQLVANNIERL